MKIGLDNLLPVFAWTLLRGEEAFQEGDSGKFQGFFYISFPQRKLTPHRTQGRKERERIHSSPWEPPPLPSTSFEVHSSSRIPMLSPPRVHFRLGSRFCRNSEGTSPPFSLSLSLLPPRSLLHCIVLGFLISLLSLAKRNHGIEAPPPLLSPYSKRRKQICIFPQVNSCARDVTPISPICFSLPDFSSFGGSSHSFHPRSLELPEMALHQENFFAFSSPKKLPKCPLILRCEEKKRSTLYPRCLFPSSFFAQFPVSLFQLPLPPFFSDL